MNQISKNSEILFLYDAKMTNPNGDMDNENKPRMDYDTNTNLVSDVRLKRYIRDYYETVKKQPIFVTENAKDAKERGAQLKNEKMTHTDLVDVRLFGAVFAETGGNTHITGPVQFNWGYSLNPVELVESSTITSSFSSGEGVGKDFRVKYSFITFNGSINAHTAEKSLLSEEDVLGFDQAMIRAIPLNRTRSKTGQTPRLYLRVEMKDDQHTLKDLREFLTLNYGEKNAFDIRQIEELNLDISKLVNYLKSEKKNISALHIWKDDMLNCIGWEDLQSEFATIWKPIVIE
ncbi:MAG TPA: type I-B CRISPR-associated protein Cas7/Csh2 [Candidatus Marinimicrobia bacterium]|nr:type I-B CRISPR-associated protein Cas7/Csh2 [Candidatus Neomarinimicrobiota bacterium]